MKGVVRYFHSTEYIWLPAGRLRLNGLADNQSQGSDNVNLDSIPSSLAGLTKSSPPGAS